MRMRAMAIVAAFLLAQAAAAKTPDFANKVWVVAESEQVATGDLRVFLSEGTLVMASSHGKPAFGTWTYDDGRLTITEEGARYDVDIVELNEETFRIRIRGPGEPVNIHFARADPPARAARADDWVELVPDAVGSAAAFRILGTVQHLELEGGLFVIRDREGLQYQPTNLPDAFRKTGLRVEVDAHRHEEQMSIGMVGPRVELLRIRDQTGDGEEPTGLPGTAWRLEDLGGKGLLDRVEATLEFSAEGKASGRGSCNRFSGTVTMTGNTIKFGALTATRMACPEAVMNQETAYLEALENAGRFELEDGFLYLHVAGRDQPLRFVAQESANPSP